MKHLIFTIVLFVVAETLSAAEQFVLFNKTDNCISLCNDISIIIDENDNEGVKIAAKNLQNDIFSVTNRKPEINGGKGNIIIMLLIKVLSNVMNLKASGKNISSPLITDNCLLQEATDEEQSLVYMNSHVSWVCLHGIGGQMFL